MAKEKQEVTEIKLLGDDLEQYHQNIKAALAQVGIKPTVALIDDSAVIAELGILQAPGLIIDGQVKAYGKVLSVEQLISLVQS